ncbi:MAG: acyl-CoA ligase (AMP-forming), exosortase A system-associated [Gammaproteobacteria bacterium]|nr:acyl-CoA ligase (AMP-forming), exosortase A system-associated [Gammaproteobacteria bacterium]
MSYLLHHLITAQAHLRPEAPALLTPTGTWTYARLAETVEWMAQGLTALGLTRGDRVALWLPKSAEAVTLLFAISRSGGVLVPINPLLKPAQVAHILQDSGARLLISQGGRLAQLGEYLPACRELRGLISVDTPTPTSWPVHTLASLHRLGEGVILHDHGRTENDLVALLYTSGSTGRPKGVMLSHRNLLAGAASVAEYLALTPEDRLLAVLPLSFDYGFSQLTVAFHRGASVMPLDYLLPNDLRKAIVNNAITVLAAVPTLWQQVAAQSWLAELNTLRILTNSGGRLPRPIIDRLCRALPQAKLFLMYGLTEAFRSTFLPPAELDRRPDSIGKAIPNAEVMVLRPDGTPCAPHEPGELVHRGPTVALGYWNDPERTAERFRPLPGRTCSLSHPERVVWSGDRVRMDEEGFLYFIGRDDDMIKTSGYRISPTEIEDVLYASGLVREAAAIGVEDDTLGQRILAVVVSATEDLDTTLLLHYCRANLPAYMVPTTIEVTTALPLTPNGKIDRRRLREQYGALSSLHVEPA